MRDFITRHLGTVALIVGGVVIVIWVLLMLAGATSQPEDNNPRGKP